MREVDAGGASPWDAPPQTLRLRGLDPTLVGGPGGAQSAIPAARPMSGLSISKRISDEAQPECQPPADIPFPAQSQVLSYLAEGALRSWAALRVGAPAKALAVSPTPTGRIAAWR
ncbi:MAG: hypothetical protein WAN05_02220 [Roseiarcus sp.]